MPMTRKKTRKIEGDKKLVYFYAKYLEDSILVCNFAV